MELFTADGLPVGPATRFSARSGSPLDLPLSSSQGSQLATLYRLFIRLHECDKLQRSDSDSSSGKSTTGNSNANGSTQQQQQQRHLNGGTDSSTGNASVTNAAGTDGANAATDSCSSRHVLTLANSLASILKPMDDASLQTFHTTRGAQQHHSLAMLEPRYQLTGVGDNDSNPLTQQGRLALAPSSLRPALEGVSRDAGMSGSRKIAWGPLMNVNGSPISGGAALIYPFFLLPARLLPHVTRMKGYPGLQAPTRARHIDGDGGGSATHNSEIEDEGDGSAVAAVALLNTNRSALLADEIPLRGVLCRPVTGAMRRAASTAATGVGESVGEPDAPAPANTGNSSNNSGSSSPLQAAQLMMETTQRLWYCVPVVADGPVVGIQGEADFSCILLGCGVTKV